MGWDWLPETPEEKAEYQRIRSEWQKYHQERHRTVSEDVAGPDDLEKSEDEDEDEPGIIIWVGRALLALLVLWMAVSFIGYSGGFFKG